MLTSLAIYAPLRNAIYCLDNEWVTFRCLNIDVWPSVEIRGLETGGAEPRHFRVPFNTLSTVEMLQETIFLRTGVNASSFTLTIPSKSSPIAGGIPLCTLDVVDNSYLNARMRLRGGAPRSSRGSSRVQRIPCRNPASIVQNFPVPRLPSWPSWEELVAAEE